MPISSASLKFSSIVALASGLAMSFSTRAMSRPSSLATASAWALSAWPRPPSSFWWKSRYFCGACMRTATATCAASTEPWLSTGNSLSTTFSFGSLFINSIMSFIARLQ